MTSSLNYTTSKEAAKPENKDKAVISDDAFAIIDLINQLINKIENVRLSLA